MRGIGAVRWVMRGIWGVRWDVRGIGGVRVIWGIGEIGNRKDVVVVETK